MTPLREAHAHIAQHGRAMTMVPLASCRTREECIHRLGDAAGSLEAGRWVLGVGIRAQAWADPTYPTRAELDEAVGPRPCCAWSFDHHALIANSSALAAARITRNSPDPTCGLIERDPRTGEPTGLLLESAAHLVWSIVPEPVGDERVQVVRRSLADFARLGFIEIHDLHAPTWLGPVLAALDDAGELPLDVWVYAPLREIDRCVREARGPGGWERPRVRLAGAKVFADGTLNSLTAWMLHPYAGARPEYPTGQAMMPRDALIDALTHTQHLGVGLAVHAIGDAAVRAALDAAEGVKPPRFVPGNTHAPSLRIEHAEIVDEADVPRFARLGVVCSPQPCHLLTDIEALVRHLPHRLHRVLPLRELIDAGCVPGRSLWFGSDAPIVRPDPSDSIVAAALRRREDMPPARAIAPAQAITEAEAWAAFTPGA